MVLSLPPALPDRDHPGWCQLWRTAPSKRRWGKSAATAAGGEGGFCDLVDTWRMGSQDL